MKILKSWGNIHTLSSKKISPNYINDIKFSEQKNTIFGNGRSYGDQSVTQSGTQILTKKLNRFISFDPEYGIIRAEGGILLSQIIDHIVPLGWFLPVTPGTKFITLAGAVANDVHGKNHHKVGSFGNFVNSIGLLRSDNGVLTLSRKQNTELFNSTISGSGLTGIILWVEIKLKKIPSQYMQVESFKYKNLDEFFELSKSSRDWEYCVAWVDCFSKEEKLGRGIFSRANFLESNLQPNVNKSFFKLIIPSFFPSQLVNGFFIKLFNIFYYHKHSISKKVNVHYDKFFYPLDSIKKWNNLYGTKGFFQFQCIIPREVSYYAICELLENIADSKQGSFLAVMKEHGDETSPGINSFCFNGTSLALDFKNNGNTTVTLLKKLEKIVLKHRGRIYLAKDALMDTSSFKNMYPNWNKLKTIKDAKLSSDQWERVLGE